MSLEKIVVAPAAPLPHKKLLVLLHGVGANERSLIECGNVLAPDSIKVSLRAPIKFGPTSFGWFQVQFTSQGPVHNWQEAEASFTLLEAELTSLSQEYEVPLADISLMGFSQGSIMTMGLALRSNLKLGQYLCFSGRTLPEFSHFARAHPSLVKNRRIYLAHGVSDDKLSVAFARDSKVLLTELEADVITLNEMAQLHLKNAQLQLVAGATHLFEELGKMSEVVKISADWCEDQLEALSSGIKSP